MLDFLQKALADDLLFQKLPKNTAAALSSAMITREFSSGQEIYRVGDPPGGLYFLFDGCLRVDLPFGSEIAVAHIYTPGTWFGQVSSMTDTNHIVGVKTVETARLGIIPSSKLNVLMKDDPDILRHMAAINQARLKTAIDAVADLMIRDTKLRLIATLIRLSGITNPHYKKTVYEIYFTQEELAQLANVARTTASKILVDLEKNGIVSISYRRIKITHAEKIESIFIAENAY